MHISIHIRMQILKRKICFKKYSQNALFVLNSQNEKRKQNLPARCGHSHFSEWAHK